MKIRNQKDFWSAVMFIAFGVSFMIWSQEYQFGTTQRMGPGYFPTVLGGLLVFLGIFSWLVFVQGLALQFPVWPIFLTR